MSKNELIYPFFLHDLYIIYIFSPQILCDFANTINIHDVSKKWVVQATKYVRVTCMIIEISIKLKLKLNVS